MARPNAKYANGRRAALQCLDSVMAEEANISLLAEALRERISSDPMGFFKEFGMPLMPRSMLEGDLGKDPEDIATDIREAVAAMDSSSAEEDPDAT